MDGNILRIVFTNEHVSSLVSNVVAPISKSTTESVVGIRFPAPSNSSVPSFPTRFDTLYNEVAKWDDVFAMLVLSLGVSGYLCTTLSGVDKIPATACHGGDAPTWAPSVVLDALATLARSFPPESAPSSTNVASATAVIPSLGTLFSVFASVSSAFRISLFLSLSQTCLIFWTRPPLRSFPVRLIGISVTIFRVGTSNTENLKTTLLCERLI